MDKRLLAVCLIISVALIGFLLFITTMEPNQSITISTNEYRENYVETITEAEKVPYTFLVYDTQQNPLTANISIHLNDQIILNETAQDGFLDIILTAKDYIVHISADGYFNESIFLKPVKSKLNTSEITLHKKLTLAGLVSNPEENPVNNAQVILKNNDQHYQDETNSQGQFRIQELKSGDYHLQVTHPDYLVYEAQQTLDQTDEFIELSLPRHANIKVSVVDQDDFPVKTVPVSLGIIKANSNITNVTTIETNLKGEVTFPALDRGIYTVEATAPDSTRSASATINATTKAQHQVTLTLPEERFFISGHVYNQISGETVGSVSVVCASLYGGGYHEFVTKTDGFFIFDDLKPGNYQLYVAEHPDYITGDFSNMALLAVEKPEMLSQPLTENVEGVEIFLKPSWKIRGHVYHADQSPVENAQVGMRINFDPKQVYGFQGSKDTGLYATTNQDGSYELIGKFEFDHEKSSIRVFAGRQDYGRRYYSNPEKYYPKPGNVIENVDITFSKVPNVKGKVINQQSGTAIANANVVFYTEQRQGQDYVEYIQRGAAMTNDNGEFSLPLDPGDYICTAYADNFIDSNKNREVSITEENNNFLIEMKTGDESIAGKVVDTDNNPISDVKVHIQRFIPEWNGNIYVDNREFVVTNTFGEFRFNMLSNISPLKDTPFMLIAMPPDPAKYKNKIVDSIPPGDTNVVITLEENDSIAEIHGRVIDYQGEPVERFELLVMSSLERSFSDNYKIISHDKEGWTPYISPDGRFQITNLDINNGPFTISAKSDVMGVGMSSSIDLEPLEIHNDVVIQLRPQLTITGRILNQETKQPLDYQSEIIPWLQLNPDNQKQRMFTADLSRRLTIRGVTNEQAWMQDMLPRVMTQEDGSFEINNLPNTRMWLIVSTGNTHPTFLDINPISINNQMNLGDIEIPFKPAINERMQPNIIKP